MKAFRFALLLGLLACEEVKEQVFAVVDILEDSQEEQAEYWRFVDIGLELGIQDQYRRNRGAAGADFDLDGDLDILLSNPTEAPLLLRNENGESFSRLNIPTTGADTAPAIADYDGDGDIDVYVSCGGWEQLCADKLLRNDGVDATGTIQWSDQTDLLSMPFDASKERASFGASWIDWDNDGDLDLHVAAKDLLLDCGRGKASCDQTEDLFFRNDRDDGFVNISKEIGVDSSWHSHQAAWLDYNLDGYMDIFIPVFGAENHLLHNNGDGSFSDLSDSIGRVLEKPIAAFGAISEDFNQDGYPDLLVSAFSITDPSMVEEGNEWQFQPEPHRLFINDAGNGFIDRTPEASEMDLKMATMGFQVIDIDLDGHFELFFGNGNPLKGARNSLISLIAEGSDFLWIDRSDAIDFAAPEDRSQYSHVAEYPYRSHGTVFYDFDNDRDIDLFIANGGARKLDYLADEDDLTMASQREPNRFFRNDSAHENNWLEIDIIGADWNLLAIGAQITIQSESNPDWQLIRYVRQNTGFNSSRPAIPLIGLGSEAGPFTVSVQLPTGEQRTQTGIQGNTEFQFSF